MHILFIEIEHRILASNEWILNIFHFFLSWDSISNGNRFHVAQIICKNEPAQAMCARPCSWLLESPVGKELVKNWNIQNTPKVWLQLLVVLMLPQLYFLVTRKVYQLTIGLLNYFTNGKLHFLKFFLKILSKIKMFLFLSGLSLY